MDTNELIQAAAAIAGQLAAQSFNTGNISAGKIQEIARTAVAIGRKIETEAPGSYTGADATASSTLGSRGAETPPPLAANRGHPNPVPSR
jgi:hypothetical protein